MTTLPVFQHASPWRSIRLLLCNRQLLINDAVSHTMAVNLESEDILKSYKAETYPSLGWEIDVTANASHAINKLSKALWSSFFRVLFVALIAIVIAFLFGLLAPNLPIAWSKVVSAIGGFLAGWATLFALGTPIETYSGKTLPELMHPRIFTALFIPGLLLSFLGQIW
jgi:hypothetical protein